MKVADNLYRRRVLWLIVLMGAVRLLLAFTTELGNDEAYYWLYAQHLKWNYFDHPPMIGLWIRAFTLNLWLDDFPGFIRLGSVASCCGATWFMYKCVRVLSNERAGWFAALLYNGFFYTGVIAGVFAFPDAPQMFFWTASLYALALLTKNETQRKYWVLFGIVCGLCIMSKVHGVFLWMGMGCYVVFYKRKWLANANLYIAIAISIAICLPILFWNIENDFITYRFNGPRINIDNAAFNLHSLLHEINAQALGNNPLCFLLIILGIVAVAKKKMVRQPALTIFNFAGILQAGLLLLIATHKDTLPHWSGPAYVSLIPVGAVYLDSIKTTYAPLLAKLCVAIHLCALVCCAGLVHFYPGNIGVQKGKLVGYGDKTLDLYGWQQAGKEFDSVYATYIADKKVPANTPMISNGWWAAHIEYYFCKPEHINMIGLGSIMNLHEYAWMNTMRKDSVNMEDAFCIVPSNGYYNVHKVYSSYYTNMDSIAGINILRGNKPAHNFYLYHMHGWIGDMPMK